MDDYYLFHKFFMLCTPKCSIKDLLLTESHGGALMAHLRMNKVYKILHKHFFWPKMKHDIQKFCSKYFKHKETKSGSQPNEFYTPLNVPNKPWTNISIQFVLGLLHTKNGKYCIFLW